MTTPSPPPPAPAPFYTPQPTSGRKSMVVDADLVHHQDAILNNENTVGSSTQKGRPMEVLPLKPKQRRRASTSTSTAPLTPKPRTPPRSSVAAAHNKERAYGRPDAWLSPSQKVHERVSVKILREIDSLKWQEMEEAERKAVEEEMMRQRKEQEQQEKENQESQRRLQDQQAAAAAAASTSEKNSKNDDDDKYDNIDPDAVYVDEKWLHTDNVATRNWNIRREQPPDSSDLLVVQQVEDLSKIKALGTEEPEWLDEDEEGLGAMERARRRVANNLMHKRWQEAIKAAEEAERNPPPPVAADDNLNDDGSLEGNIDPHNLVSSSSQEIKTPDKSSSSSVDFYGSMNAIPFLKKTPTKSSPTNTKSSSPPKKGGALTNAEKSAKLKKKMKKQQQKEKQQLQEQRQLWKSMSALDHNEELLNRPNDFLPLTPGREKRDAVKVTTTATTKRENNATPTKSPTMEKAKQRAYGRPNEWISPQDTTKKDKTIPMIPTFPGLNDDDVSISSATDEE
mmetsp:Transcript_8026/g.23058  ORF Transcript_8026/g.23058 Transcript_8026/m.23058 type:complete len:509 (+) Transcript_8026:144-1670(+)|eukprot:CAMPEP_0119545680 /NCGR_PEP_ID=MMETSP1352-20130426/361_1 /TAXON_ID=265584 /ORGANISM="Stauroneis constricta, Strain CCMP1120" /LENGTH=508 /DNA_ID=CAMNT_0007590259 /DNA_START=473 /DNA_END=1999 /DNA_ORIENTATION=-